MATKPNPTLTLELDVADDTVVGANRWARSMARVHSVSAELVQARGPGGGWPIWRFTGPESALRRLFDEYNGGPEFVQYSGASPDSEDPFLEYLV